MQKLLSLVLALVLLTCSIPFAAAEAAQPAAETITPLLLSSLAYDVASHTASAEDMAFFAAAAIIDVTLAELTETSDQMLAALESDAFYLLVSEDNATLQLSIYTDGTRFDFMHTPSEATALVTTAAWEHTAAEAETDVSSLIAPGGWASYTKVDTNMTAYCIIGILEVLQGDTEATAE